MIAGCILEDTVEEDSVIVFLGDDGVSVHQFETNQEAVELITEKEPEIIAFDVGLNEAREGLTEDEEELQEEGYIFTPSKQDTKRIKRLEALQKHLFNEMGAEQPEIIRFEPQITAEELAIHDDSGLESYGIDTEEIKSAKQFDAMLGAVTARFYEQNQHTDLDVIVPKTGESEE